MSANTKIEWCDHTFNIVWGCEKVSEACAHCYAEAWAKRTGHNVWGKGAPRRVFGAKHWAEPLAWNRAAEKAGERRRVFCSSMADVFEDHPTVEMERAKLWPLIEATPWLDWLLLTKRPENFRAMLPAEWLKGGRGRFPLNTWLGMTVENQARLEERVGEFIGLPGVHFLSCEPLLGPIDITDVVHVLGHVFVHWIICGGESGPQARPMHPDWARDLRDDCKELRVPFFFKQWGELIPWGWDEQEFNNVLRSQHGKDLWHDDAPRDLMNLPKGWDMLDITCDATLVQRVGKAAAGRLLDGRTHDAFPLVDFEAGTVTL